MLRVESPALPVIVFLGIFLICPCTSAAMMKRVYDKEDPKNPLGKGFFLHDLDIYGERLGGKPIFEHLDPSCIIKQNESRRTHEKFKKYASVNSFFKSLQTDSSVGVSVGRGPFTMGTTLRVKTGSMSGGSTAVMGNYLRVWTSTQVNALTKKCYQNPRNFASEFVKRLKRLPLSIGDPRHKSSWGEYHRFLKTFGSHVVVKEHLGASVRQWTFAKSSRRYSEKMLQIASCVKFSTTLAITRIGVGACTGFTSRDIQSASKLRVHSNTEVLGGSDVTRNEVSHKRTKGLIKKLMDEGREKPSPIDYKYEAIWDLISVAYHGSDRTSTKMRARAETLRQYYEGYLDYGCTYKSFVTHDGGELPGRWFARGRRHDYLHPRYECWLEREGCHSDRDCHLTWLLGWASCWGQTCLQYVKPKHGEKAMSVRSCPKHGPHHRLDRSCYWKLSQGRCKRGHGGYRNTRVWPVSDDQQAMSNVTTTSLPFESFVEQFVDPLVEQLDETYN